MNNTLPDKRIRSRLPHLLLAGLLLGAVALPSPNWQKPLSVIRH